MESFILNPPKQAILDRVAIHAAEKASQALTSWFGQPVKIHTDGFATCSPNECSTVINGGETPVAAVYTGIEGSLTGHVLLAFPDEVASRLVSILTGESPTPAAEFDEMAISAVTETGNIVSSAFLNGLAGMLNVKVQPTAPTYLYDMGAAIIQPLVAGQLEHSDGILYIQARFEIDEVCLDWWLYVMPSAESMQAMAALLH